MHFANGWMLHFLWLTPFITLIYLWDERTRRNCLSLWGGPRIISRLTESLSIKKRVLQKILELVGFMLMIIALARPQAGISHSEVQRKGIDVVIAMDTSSSMLAEDYKPNRLAKAKQELLSLLEYLQGNRIALVGFAGAAITLCPSTLDTNALKIYLDVLDTQLMDIQGTAIGDAIRKTIPLFEPSKTHGKLIVLLTDGEDHETKPLEAAKEAARKGIRIYTIGIGVGQGEPIPTFNGKGERTGHKRNENGGVVLTRLDEKILQEISILTGGKYYRATPRGLEVDHIFKEIKQLEKGQLGTKRLMHYEDRFQIPLMIALICLILAELIGDRKRIFFEIKSKLSRINMNP